MPGKNLIELPLSDSESGDFNVVIETPKGSGIKYKYDEDTGIFRISKIMPAGFQFPFNFGFFPSTLGDDGDPLDVLLLMDSPVQMGVIATAKVVGVIEAEQTEKKETVRNDRLIAVPTAPRSAKITKLSEFHDEVLHQIEFYFRSYNEFLGRKFKPLGRTGAARAEGLIKEANKKYKKKR